jgi:hypothetical protein
VHAFLQKIAYWPVFLDDAAIDQITMLSIELTGAALIRNREQAPSRRAFGPMAAIRRSHPY